MAGVLFLHTNHGQSITTALGRQPEIDDLGKLLLQQRHEHLVERLAEHGRLVRRLAGIGAVIDRVTAHRDALDREHRETVLFVVIAGMVAERAFQRGLARMNDPLQDDLGRGRDAEIVAERRGDLGLGAAQQAGELVFGQRIRHRRHRAQDGRRVGTDGDAERKRLARMGLLEIAEIERPAALRQPAHDDLVRADDLLAVDAQVLARFTRAFADDQAPGNQRPGVTRPTGLYGQAREIDVLAFPDHFLAGWRAHLLGRHVEHLLEQRQLVPGVAQALGRFRFLQVGEQLADLAQSGRVLLTHAQRHPLDRAKQVGQHRH